ncbi:MAG TPA: hypothetical protein VM100_13650 [Longimicrobiales bacterium]|nr:hypothetical protein [Longimicrobiales bacterium]
MAPVSILLCAFVIAGSQASGQCPQRAGAQTTTGWNDFRAGRIGEARIAFAAALKLCPAAADALTGLSYVALREGRAREAILLADSVLKRHPENEDALIARGIGALRVVDYTTANRIFVSILARNPNNSEVKQYLASIPAGLGKAPPRPPLVLPDTVIAHARIAHRYFEVSTSQGWSRFYIKGMNLGAALPGKHPSEFPDSATYALWLQQMHDMGVNAVRLYTVHPPAFYQALLDFNRANESSPLRIIHGVWTELPPRHDFDDAKFVGAFQSEMRRVVDLLHGRADIVPRAGHASGFYTADVSRWVTAYIIGREWEPFSVVKYNKLRSTRTRFTGRFLQVSAGNPMEVWLARMCDYMVAYETDRYHTQSPVAFTNWPTLDPLKHPTESTVAEELVMRRRNGERIDERPREYDNDIVSLDATRVRPTTAFKAGWFVSYHAYPYYPDFMIYENGFENYIRALLAASDSLPVLISEYGVPYSLGIGHIDPRGRHHGGHSEKEGAEINAQLTREIANAGAAGGALFAWIDEWFKKNWVTIEFELPAERTRLWHNRLDAEQHYGIIAMDAARPLQWQKVAEVGGVSLRAASDEAYLHLELDGASERDVMVGFDTVDPRRGDSRWPEKIGASSPVGLEFVLIATRDTVRVVADSASNPFRFPDIRRTAKPGSLPFSVPPNPPAGMFTAPLHMRLNRPFRTIANSDGAYTTLRVITNRQRYAHDGNELKAIGYDRGILERGAEPDGQWQRVDGKLRVRIPWGLLNFTDPSGKRVLQDGSRISTTFGTVVINDMRLVFAVKQGEQWQQSNVGSYKLESWDEPSYTARKRPAYDVMRATFEGLDHH